MGFQSAPIRLLDFNAAGLPLVHPHAASRIERLAAEISAGGYDLVALQEIWTRSLLLRLSRRARLPVVVRRPGINGLVLLSRFKAVRARFYPFSVRAAPYELISGDLDALCRKGVLAVRLETPFGELDVFNVHMIADVTRDHFTVRVSQILELAEFLRDFSRGGPHLVLGDFNFPPGGIQHGLVLSLLGVEDPGYRGGRELCGPTNGERRIDYIFGRGVRTHRVFEQLLLSDHAGIEGSLVPPFVVCAPGPESSRSLDRAAAILRDAIAGLEIEAAERSLKGRLFRGFKRAQAARLEAVLKRVSPGRGPPAQLLAANRG